MRTPIQKINTIINRYLAPLGYRANYGADFCCDVEKGVIYWTLYTPLNVDEWFMDFARNNGLKYECGTFILALFHEIGHLETYNLNSDKILDYCEEQKELITDEMAKTKKWNDFYFNLPIEKRATRWAIRFINAFPEECKILNDKVAKIAATLSH